MQEIIELERAGYRFTLEDGHIRYTHAGPAPQSPVLHKFLERVRQSPDRAVAFLRRREGQGHSEGLSTQAHTPGPDDAAAQWASVFGGQSDPGGVKAKQALEAELSALIDTWQADPDRQRDAGFARRYAELATALDFPFIGDDGVTDLGAAGWREWVETF